MPLGVTTSYAMGIHLPALGRSLYLGQMTVFVPWEKMKAGGPLVGVTDVVRKRLLALAPTAADATRLPEEQDRRS